MPLHAHNSDVTGVSFQMFIQPDVSVLGTLFMALRVFVVNTCCLVIMDFFFCLMIVCYVLSDVQIFDLSSTIYFLIFHYSLVFFLFNNEKQHSLSEFYVSCIYCTNI